MAITTVGTPFVAYAQLTNGAPGPVAFTLYTVMGSASYALASNERVYITNITLSSNDTAVALVTLDTGDTGGTGDTTPTKLVSAYLSASQYLQPEQIPPGCCRGVFGVAPRIAATAVTSGKTVEAILKGYIAKT